jgi:hypothetical protein
MNSYIIGDVFNINQGNVGIGSTTPTSKLDIIGTITSTNVISDLTGNVSGSISGGSVAGEGSGLTALNATNISSGTLDNARLPSAISVTSLTGDGSGLTSLNATNISSGTLNNARLPSTITVTTVNADVTGDLTGNVSGSISGGSVAGEGSGLTALNATNISSGTLDNARLPSAISVTSLTGDGSGLTSLNATNISSGTLNNARLPSTITVTTVNADVTGDLTGNVSGSISGGSVAGEGSGLTALNATNISSGTLDNARLPSAISVTSLTGDGSGLTALNADNISSGTLNNARLPSIINTTTLIGTQVGIGTNTPQENLHVEGNIYSTGNIVASNLSIIGDFTTLNTVTSNTEQIVVYNQGTGPALKVYQTGIQPIAEFYDGDYSEASQVVVKIANDGKLGIGTEPREKLDIIGTAIVSTKVGIGSTQPISELDITGSLIASGNVSGAYINGNGTGLTSLNATNISSGTLDNARLPSAISVTSLTGDGSGLTALNADNISSGTLNNARLPSAISVTSLTGDGSGLTALNATNISSGTLNNARLPSTITVTTVNADVTGNVSGSISGGSVAGEGSGLTALNATNISSGTLDNARLPSAISVTSLTGDGSGLTALNADNISSGTLNNARLPSTITVTTVNADVTGDLTGNVSGSISGGSVAGEGSGLTALNATNISSGTLDNARLPSAISVTSLTGDGSGLTALNATNISSGTLNNARLPSTITVTTVNADVTGDVTGNVSGSISGGSIAGEGSGLTALNATNISSGTLDNARLPSAISVTSLTGDGSGLTALNATNISSGTLNNARLPSTITVTTVNADVTGDLTGNVSGSISGGSVAGEGSGLTALNATNISSGTLDNARLPSAISVTSLTGDGSGLTALNADNISSGTIDSARLPTITATVDTSEINSSNIVILGDILKIYSQYNSNIAHITENAFKLPSGSSNLRPDVPTEGEIRFNTDINRFEGYYSSNLGWNTITNESVYSFSATYLSSNQYIAIANSNVGEIAQFNAQYSVPGSTYDISTYKYVVPQNGVYSFDVSLPNSPLMDIERERIVNDVTTYTTLKSLDYSYTPISSLHISAVQLQTNDKVYVRIYTDVDGATQYNSRFEGNLVSGGLSTSTMSTTVTDEVRSFQYSCSSNTEIVMSQPLDQILPLQVKVYDTDNLWDVGTNSFTVPSGYAGFWDITVNGIVNTFNIYKTPSGGSSQLFGTIMNNGTKQLLLNVGDKIEIYFTSTISASYSHYYFITATQIAKPHTISSLVNVTKGFKYKLASDQNITSGTSTKINFTDPVFEVGDVFDSTNNWLLSGVTTSGLWSFDFRVGGQDGELLVVDEKAENTNGGDLGANPVTRDLNTVKKNTIAGASLATNTITLPPGTYEAEAYSTIYLIDRCQISLRDTSDNSILVQGISDFAWASYLGYSVCSARGFFTINTTTNIQLILNRQTNPANAYEGGVGDASAFGTEIFSLVHLKRVPGTLTLNHYDYSTANSNVYSYNGDNGSSTLYVEEGDKVWLESTESVSSSNSYFEGVLTTSVNLTVDESTVYTRGFHYTRTTNQAITEGSNITIEYSTKVQNTTGLAETILNGVFTTPNSGLWRFDFAAGGQDGELLVVDEKAENTNGGDFGANPVVRDLNTVRKNTIAGASLATNTITLPPGTYDTEAYSTSYLTDRMQISIRDTGNNILVQGMSDHTNPTYGGYSTMFAKGFFTINTTTNIQLIFNRSTNVANVYEGGVGDISAYGPEIYSLVHLKRVPGNLTLYKTPVSTISPLTYDSPILMGTYDASGGHQVVTCAKYDKVEVKYNGYLIADSSDRKVFFSGQQTAATTTTEAVGLIADDVTGVIETAGSFNVGSHLDVVGNITSGSNLTVNGNFYSPGCIVQATSENVHDIVSYASSASATEITPLNIVITPKFVGSKIQLQWMINFEAHQDVVFLIYRKIGTGSVTKIGYNNTIADNIWNGVASSSYDQENLSTMANCYINWTDSPNTLEEVTYYVYYQATQTGIARPFYLNRTVGSTDVGQSIYERTVSSKSGFEIAQ